jgi:hypothetical protein
LIAFKETNANGGRSLRQRMTTGGGKQTAEAQRLSFSLRCLWALSVSAVKESVPRESSCEKDKKAGVHCRGNCLIV